MSQLTESEIVATYFKSVTGGRSLQLDLHPGGVLEEKETFSQMRSTGGSNEPWKGTYELHDDCTLVTQIGPFKTVYVPGEFPGVYHGVETKHDDNCYRAIVQLVQMRV